MGTQGGVIAWYNASRVSAGGPRKRSEKSPTRKTPICAEGLASRSDHGPLAAKASPLWFCLIYWSATAKMYTLVVVVGWSKEPLLLWTNLPVRDKKSACHSDLGNSHGGLSLKALVNTCYNLTVLAMPGAGWKSSGRVGSEVCRRPGSMVP